MSEARAGGSDNAPAGTAATSGAPALEVRGITKIYETMLALDAVALTVARGEVQGLVGKNGAGKSTLMKIVSGAIRADAGTIFVGGTKVDPLNPILARRAGIGVVHQNPELHLNLSVAANLLLGQERRNRFRLIDEKAMLRRAEEVLGKLGLSLPPTRLLADLDLADRQLVAIAKAVVGEARVLLLDEPTAALNKSQIEFLFRLIRSISADGLATVFVSHHLDEVLAISDRVAIMRNGRNAGVVRASRTRKDDLIEMMVGRRLEATPAVRRRATARPAALSLTGVSVEGALDAITQTFGQGEIVGLVSRTGGGAGALAAVIGGVGKPAGDMVLDGRPFRPRSIREAVAGGAIFVPEDMRGKGLVLPMSAAGNMTLARVGALSRRPCIDLGAELAETREIGATLNLKPADTRQEAGTLSGGNQRKLLIGRAMLAGARLLALEEPTQGVDVEARRQIHEQLRDLAAQGGTVVFSSTDPEELIELADRIVLLAKGAVVAEIAPGAVTSETLLLAVQTDGASLKETASD